MNDMKAPKRIATTILNSLQGGVVPPSGLGYIAVGREQEIAALLKDIEIIEDGGATFRLVTGNYGSGKTFLLQTIKEHAVAKGLVVAFADLSPTRSLIGSFINKKGLATYRELMCNVCTKSKPTGAALDKILDDWLNNVWMEIAMSLSGGAIAGNDLEGLVNERINETIKGMHDMVRGFDFATVLTIYWKASRAKDEERKAKALRWLRGEYGTKKDAKADLGVPSIINDDDWFDYIKLFSVLFNRIGYKGFIIMIDEIINLYKCANPTTRQRNYEKMLSMYNDALQGRASNLGIIMGGTPQSVESKTRGVFSYEALRSRLQSGSFSDPSIINLMAPIIHIQQLTKSEMIVLLEKLTSMHADLHKYVATITTEDIIYFVNNVFEKSKDAYITPRSIIRDYIDVMNILMQNPQLNIRHVVDSYQWNEDKEEESGDISD